MREMKGSMVKKTVIRVLHTLKHTGKISSYATKINLIFKSFTICKSLFNGETTGWTRNGTLGSFPLSLLAPMLLLYSIQKGLRYGRLKPKQIVFEIPNKILKQHCLQMKGNKTKRKPREWIRMTPA